MLSFIHFMDVIDSYGGSKGVRDTIVEDGLWGSLAHPADPEKSASHNNDLKMSGMILRHVGQF